eukprot:3594213-Alexandrium_andersonii.AAC.1
MYALKETAQAAVKAAQDTLSTVPEEDLTKSLRAAVELRKSLCAAWLGPQEAFKVDMDKGTFKDLLRKPSANGESPEPAELKHSSELEAQATCLGATASCPDTMKEAVAAFNLLMDYAREVSTNLNNSAKSLKSAHTRQVELKARNEKSAQDKEQRRLEKEAKKANAASQAEAKAAAKLAAKEAVANAAPGGGGDSSWAVLNMPLASLPA